nr:hypothetical protein [Tanacetum cinerariifolium]
MSYAILLRRSWYTEFPFNSLHPTELIEGFIRFLTFSVSAGAPISAGDPNPAVTSVFAGFFVFAASSIPTITPTAAGIPIPAGDFVPAGHISFLLVVSHSCWYMAITAG